MAGTSVLKLKVDDKEYNASLKQAQQGMQHLEQSLKDAGKSFKQVDKSVVDYVRGIGQMEAQSKTARGRISEMSSAFVELSLQYKNMSDEVKGSNVGKALAESMEQLKQRTIDAKSELEDLSKALNNTKMPEISTGGSDGLSSMMAVFGGNMMTKGVELLTSALSNLGNQMMDISQKAMEMSVNSEGILMAFERLNNPALLDQLRQATHGTVSDLELMKAAVKFDDFNLPVEELGTMLAFAQQKAKDTGQSIDYMVDSIVTGLGRKSLMILDNLGLSATQIKERMGETGDMTKAVGEIIREQMSSAGDYVETAADRAARANAELENSYIELGNKMRETFGIGSVEELNTYINRELIITLEFTTDWVGRVQNTMSGIVGVFNDIKEASPFADMLEDIVALYTPLTALLGLRSLLFGDNKSTGVTGGAGTGGLTPKPETESSFSITTDSNGNVVNASRNGTDVTSEYLKSLKLNPKTPKKVGGGGGSTVPKTEEQENSAQIQKLAREFEKASDERRKAIQEEIKALQQRNAEIKYYQELALGKESGPLKKDIAEGTATGLDTTSVEDRLKQKLDPTTIVTPLQALEEELKHVIELQALAWSPEQFADYQERIDEIRKKIGLFKGISKTGEDTKDSWQDAAKAVQSVGSAMQNIEDPAAKVAGTVLQAVANVALGYANALTMAKEAGGPWGWIAFAATGLATMMTTISAIHSATGYAEGGMVKGNSYSGDNLQAMIDGGAGGFAGLNSGEIVLNRAAQGNLASQLEGAGANTHLSASVSGEQILLVANRTTRRQGKGELVTWR